MMRIDAFFLYSRFQKVLDNGLGRTLHSSTKVKPDKPPPTPQPRLVIANPLHIRSNKAYLTD